MLKALPGSGLPAGLKRRVAVGEKLEDRIFVFENKATFVSAANEAGGFQFFDGSVFCQGVGKDQCPFGFANGRPSLRRRKGGAAVDEGKIGIKMVY